MTLTGRVFYKHRMTVCFEGLSSYVCRTTSPRLSSYVCVCKIPTANSPPAPLCKQRGVTFLSELLFKWKSRFEKTWSWFPPLCFQRGGRG